MDQLTRIHYPHVCQMPLTLQTWNRPPSGCTSGNHPEPVVHPRMNSRSEHYTFYCVIPPLTMHSPCLVFVLLYCRVFIVSPPSSADRRCDRCRCFPLVRLLRRRSYPYYRASRQAVPHPLSQIPPIYLYFICCTRHCCCYVISYPTA